MIEDGVKSAIQAARQEAASHLPGHLSLHEVEEVVNVGRPDAIDVDLFVGLGFDVIVELNLEFSIGVTWENPVDKLADIVSLVENPPATVHELLDRLWGDLQPSEIRVSERLQAIVGEQGCVKWQGDKVEERVVNYIGHRGWLDKKLRP